ncbi:MAG: YfhO family protein, partial [Chloroflexota bacterium]|nr:YfhO family protein [Chloroflexota bacterium]
APSACAGRTAAGAAAAWAGLALLVVPLIGALIGAGQLLPLLELSQESWRIHGFSYQDAVEYSLPPTNLVTLLLPFFFRIGDTGQWSLWPAWEVVLYVGIVPLYLALAAVVAVRRWPVPFFGSVAFVATIISLGAYAPYGLYAALLQIPWLSVQRAPARLAMLVTLALAILAAYGADWLVQRGGAAGGRLPHRGRPLVALQLAALATLGLLVFHLVAWRAWLHADRGWALDVVGRTYLRLVQDPLQGLTPVDVVRGLDSTLDLANPKTALSVGLLAAFALLLLVWRELPRLAPLWRSALVLLVAADLLFFAADLHPLVPADELAALEPSARFLAERAGQGRALTHPDAAPTRPNRLLPIGVAEAAGYSPLQLGRHRWYVTTVQSVDNSLLDLWGVRWLVEPRTSPSLPSYQQVAYHPRRPLMVGGVGTPNGQVTFDVGAVAATEIRTVVALRDGATIPDGEVVGEWLVVDDQAVRTILPIRAGREVADDRHGMPGVRIAHRPATAAGRLPGTDGQLGPVLSYAALDLPRHASLTRVEYRHVNPVGESAVYGLTLHDATDDGFEQVTRQAKYALAYRDPAVSIYENREAFPRAFVVSEPIWVADADAARARLRAGPFDPRRQVVLEGEAPAGADQSGIRPDLTPAFVADDGWRAVTIDASSPVGGYLVLTDPYFPGWRAFVDGDEVPIRRADYLFRAVELPPGEHRIQFVFDPPYLGLGLILSQAGLALGLGTVTVAVFGRRRGWRLSWPWGQIG